MLSAQKLSAQAVIRLLELAPHPEGGHYRETFRDIRTVEGGRATSTAIYFLLGDWTLCGCTVAPGFQFEGFELAPKGWTPGR